MPSDRKPLKIAVYAIALNEEKHVLRWWESARDADLVLLADTGSSDKTVEIADTTGIRVERIHVNPWRFDIARNAALSLIPGDYDLCLAIDLDEVLPDGWRNIVEKGYESGLRWMSFKMVTSRDSKKQITSYFIQNKIHARKNFSWRYLVHEYLVANPNQEIPRGVLNLEVDHLFDSSKSRKHYLEILTRNLTEYPNEFHAYLLIIREYLNRKDWSNVFKKATQAKSLVPPNAFALSLICRWGSEAAFNLDFQDAAMMWAKEACEHYPNGYENWLWLAKMEYHSGNFELAQSHAAKVQLLKPLNNGFGDPNAWKWDGFNWIAASSFKLGRLKEAVHFGAKAHQGFPESNQIQKNLEIYSRSLDLRNATSRQKGLRTNLANFPPTYVLTLKNATDRQQKFFESCTKFGVQAPIVIEGVPATGNSREELFHAISQSHLKAIKKFYEDCASDWAVICEDDASFALSELWPFEWKEKFDEVMPLGIDILQMSCIVTDSNSFISALHRRREGKDWSTGIYLISRNGALQILSNTKNKVPESFSTESFLLDGLDVYTLPIFTCDGVLASSRDQSHIEKFHIPSWNKTREYYESLWAASGA